MSGAKQLQEGSGVEASGEESAGEMTWEKPAFDSGNPNLKFQNPRLLRKRRTHYNSISHAGVNGLTLASGNPASSGDGLLMGTRGPYGKNSRKSRNGFRQTPKKASDKDVWIRVGDELDELELDHDDPDYESEEESPVVIESVKAVLSDEDFEEFFSTLVREYYDHCKVEEVIDALKDIAMTSLQRRRLPVLAINLALQHKMGHCELTSELLSAMCGKVISMSGMQQGFQLLLDDMPDIVIDVPKAPEYVGRFIARAVADDILPPKFVQQFKEVNAAMPPAGTSPVVADTVHPPVRIASRRDSASIADSVGANTRSSSGVSSGCDSNAHMMPSGDAPVNYALQAINKAEALLTLSHAYRHLDIVWGIPPNERVTTMLMKQIYCILLEYLRTGSFEDALSSLQELDSPHFHHELVYQAILLVLAREADDHVSDRMLELLDKLCRSVVISFDQLMTGVRRVYAELPELHQDLPIVYVLLERFLRAAVAKGFLPQKLANEMPANPRKRYVSEGDGFRKTAPTDRV
ncbi:Programmed cell death protein 4 [Taenia crassiceps]|uniref:Programmed cell death protein 4 n=1 Tax=Taenia crassiceps TaxID=6207 RepID=A0ABR4QS09_9CEST